MPSRNRALKPLMSLRKKLLPLLPAPLYRALQTRRHNQSLAAYRGLSAADVFAHIYDTQAWGRHHEDSPFCSGPGSHEAGIVGTYVAAVRYYLRELGLNPDAVDLGCGDFNIGRQLHDACGAYIACDIVQALIEFNRKHFAALDVDFRVLDLVCDELPVGDVVFIRQVLQHLSNEHIAQALPQIQRSFRHLVLTEHLPANTNFTPNRNKPAGPDIRLHLNSGVVLTEPPFSLRVRSERELCEVPQFGGVIRTTAYELA